MNSYQMSVIIMISGLLFLFIYGRMYVDDVTSYNKKDTFDFASQMHSQDCCGSTLNIYIIIVFKVLSSI